MPQKGDEFLLLENQHVMNLTPCDRLPMTDTDIEEIYTLAPAALRNGQPSFAVHIFPFRMSQKRLGHMRHSRWLPFWLNLKQGYDHFAKTRRPPLVLVHEQRYVFPQP